MTTDTIQNATDKLAATAADVIAAASKAFPEVAGHGFEMYAKYAFAMGISDIFCGGVALVVATISVFLARRAIIACLNDKYNDAYQVAVIVCSILTVASTVAFISNVSSGITKVIAPDGYVVSEIISNVGGGSK